MFKLKKISGIISLLLVGAVDAPCFAEDVMATPGDVPAIAESRPLAPSKPLAVEKSKETKPAGSLSQPKPSKTVSSAPATGTADAAKPPVADEPSKPTAVAERATSGSSAPVKVKAEPEKAAPSVAAAPAPARAGASDKSAMETLLERARYWQRTGQMGLSVSAWQRVLISDPRQEEALSGLASYYMKSGQRDRKSVV
jgi:hypothetical protein